MCQLMGMNCNVPTDFTFSFKGFAKRGGETDKHEHGWGLAIYEGRGLRTFHDSLPAAKSSIADFVSKYPIQTLNMMAHIRYATQGTVSLENVHPFQREMWGIQWSFAHNGEVPKFTGKSLKEYPRLRRCKELFYHPVGETDSEAVFCAILNALRTEFVELPTLPNLYETIQRLCAEIVQGEEDTTILNFLLGCGQFTQFAYSWPGKRPGSEVWNGLFYTIRRPPFATATQLKDVDYAVDFSTCAAPTDRVAIIATAPLTSNEEWFEFKRGQLLMFNNGWGYSELHDCHEIEEQGRGLVSNTMPKQGKCCKGYGTPALLRSLVDQVIKEQQSSGAVHALPYAKEGADLGCGSGCSGLSFRNCVTRLTGVDISLEMIDRAKLRGCYDCLLAGDIETVLQEASVKFDIIFASNVLAFIQDIRGVFAAVRKSLAPNGIFAFSAETIDLEDGEQGEKKEDQGHTGGDQFRLVLQSCARYAHESIYIRELASEHGFSIARIQESNLREYDGRIVKSVVYVLVTMSS